MKKDLKFCSLLSLLILTNACDLDTETKNDIETVEKQIDKNIEKANQEKIALQIHLKRLQMKKLIF